MSEQSTATTTELTWSVDGFQAFWANPDPALVPAVLTEDVVGRWAGRDEPVHGKEDYTECIAALVRALPGMHLEVGEHARNGEMHFVRWIMFATGAHGAFELTGIDRIRLRGGLVAENIVVCDTAAFAARAGIPIPWA